MPMRTPYWNWPDHLPSEAAEALLDLATGVIPQAAKPVVAGSDPFARPDAQRRSRVMANVEELERSLDYPWDKWTVLLHPAQRTLVERDYSGPARVAGSAGTGKTIVALHRAFFLIRANPDARVLLTTHSETLANVLRTKLRGLISNEPRLGERLEAHSMNAIGRRLYELNFGRAQVAPRETVREVLSETARAVEGHKFSPQFLLTEWEQVVDAWQLESWESYRDVVRLGRKTRLQEAQRVVLWSIFERVRSALESRGLATWPDMFSQVASKIGEIPHPPFEFAVVDEAQDVSVPQLRFLAALGAGRPNSLFFAGDLGQRIFQQPFSWKALGVDVRGRSSTRGSTTGRRTRSGRRPIGCWVPAYPTSMATRRNVGAQSQRSTVRRRTSWFWILPRKKSRPSANGWRNERRKGSCHTKSASSSAQGKSSTVLVRRSRMQTSPTKCSTTILRPSLDGLRSALCNLAKGLEFRTVVVMACDDEVIPLQERIEAVADDADLEEVYNTERHLLYVACTRARDHLLVTSVDPASEFLDDMRI